MTESGYSSGLIPLSTQFIRKAEKEMAQHSEDRMLFIRVERSETQILYDFCEHFEKKGMKCVPKYMPTEDYTRIELSW